MSAKREVDDKVNEKVNDKSRAMVVSPPAFAASLNQIVSNQT